ncbi:excalibur calcium-binding domain-containing protein [Novosphingobium sp.]|uniref:excalibur calcium-binding domain-containing protein n=1 Tax=Novosphingobium sp. TaxID=1874826 RepID=UPI00344579B5
MPGAASARSKRKSSGRRRGGRGRVSSGGGDASFSSCKEARANGYSRIRRGEPGYSARLDRDGDGVACE